MNELTNDLLPTPENLNNYVEKTTPGNFPFIKKTVRAFLQAIYSSSLVTDKIGELNSFYDPSERIFVPYEQSVFVKHAPDSASLSYIMWSRVIKNEAFLNAIGLKFLGQPALIRYGDGFAEKAVANLDSGNYYTDTYINTDMDTAVTYPVCAYLLPYTLNGVSYEGIASKSWVETSVVQISTFLVALVPARLPIVFLFTPVLFVTPSEHIGVSYSTDNPFTNEAQRTYLASLTEEQISSLTFDFFTNSASFEITLLQNSEKIKRYRIQQRTAFTNVSFIPHDSHLSPFDLTLDTSLWVSGYFKVKTCDIVLDFNFN